MTRTFNLKINLDNSEMRTANDIGGALRKLADGITGLGTLKLIGDIRDENGNTVGAFSTDEAFEGGTVIHGTLKSSDLLVAFRDELALKLAEYPGEATEGMKAARRVMQEAGVLITNMDESGEYAADVDYGRLADHASELIADLEDKLCELAPEGFYFGAHEGDGSDFGYWPVGEDEADENV